MKIDALPRKAVLGYLELTRLPLTAAEWALGRTEGTWPITIAADRLQAMVKDAAGTVLRDEHLKAAAKLQTAALDERMRALHADTQAERIREQADEQLARERRTAQEAKAEVATRAAARERQVEKKVGAEKSAARKVADAEDEVLSTREAAAAREQLAAEAKAVRDERAAIEAKAEAIDLEDELAAVREARKQA